MSTNSAVWNELLAEIQAWMIDNGFGNSVYLSEAPGEETISQYAVQVIPGGDTALHWRSGVALQEAKIDIVVWWRNLLDPTNRATYRIAGTAGIESFIDGLRILLNQNDLNGQLTIPLTWRSGGQVEQVTDLVGWMRGTETFVCAFENMGA
jgi:hypothetical protein